MKLLLFVEGDTERALRKFFRRWLDDRLSERVGIKIVQFEGWRDYDDEIARKVSLQLSDESETDVIGAIGLLDLYGPTFYPRDKVGVADRYTWAKSYLEKKVDHPRFRQHFAVHETEAWLLANPENLPDPVRKALPGRCSRPEEVNFDEPPAKLLDRLYRAKLRKHYKKVIDGAKLFEALEPSRAAQKCPYLRALLDDMLSLAQDRGISKKVST